MAGKILHELPDLVKANVISPETADRIREYYQVRHKGTENRLFVAFGILGALLIGLGIILIVAHNWDELPRMVKTGFAFLPLAIGQAACGYAFFRKPDNQVWKETAGAFLAMAIGASISMVSQVYHIPGNLSSFLLTWMLLALPVVYLMRSGMASLLYVAGITGYAAESGYNFSHHSENYTYWLLLAAALPFYIFYLIRKKPASNFALFHHWVLPLSVAIALGTVGKSTEELLFVAYSSLFGLFYILGGSFFIQAEKHSANGYRLLGFLGTIGLLLFLSFRQVWEGLAKPELLTGSTFVSPEFLAALVISALAAVLLFRKQKPVGFKNIELPEVTFALFILIFKLSFVSVILAAVLVNLLVLFLGIATIRKGTHLNHLGILNAGLLIIAALVTCRFFDTDLTFVVRGLLFIGVGATFFFANYRMLKLRKNHEV